MNGEHNTPIGTPVVIAPGKIPLVGEYAVREEGIVVLAAIARHAKAQFVPHMDSMSLMLSEVVKRTKAKLGEVSAALPSGAVLVAMDELEQGNLSRGFGSSAAIAVASIGAVFESLGLDIEDRKPEILDIARAARQTSPEGASSGAELAAAANGGLIKIVHQRDAQPQVEALALPAGLHLVLFSVNQSIPTHLVVEGLQTHALRSAARHGQAMAELHAIARRFVEETEAGSATGAVVAAGRYGDRLAELSATASVPIMTDAFTRASDLARELGGIAKPVGAGHGDTGVALFSTPEAASLFRRACTPPLTALDGGLDRLGVRRQDPEADKDSEPIDAEFTELSGVVLEPERDVVTIECRAEFADTDPVKLQQGLVLVSTGQAPSAPPGVRRRLVRASLVALVLVFVAWMALPISTRAPGLRTTTLPLVHGGNVNVAAAATTKLPAPSAEATRHAGTNSLPREQPPAESAATTPSKRLPEDVATRHRKEVSRKLVPADVAKVRHHSPASHSPPDPAKPLPRAGKLEATDF
jgi:phosphomevalonate kinase